MNFTFISYNCVSEHTSAEEWIRRISPLAGIMESLAQENTVHYIGQIGFAGTHIHNKVNYNFFNINKQRRFPHKLHRFIKNLKPDVVVVAGLSFSLRLIQLKLYLPKATLIIALHHADRPFRGLKKLLQRTADRFIGAYFFSSLGNAQEWLDASIISKKQKCYEVLSGSTHFSGKNKDVCREKLKISADPMFLWIGNLDMNKDPLNVLDGFEKYIPTHPTAMLYMIYQSEKILNAVRNKIDQSLSLQNNVILVGYVPHHELEFWYSASDYFISGSHREAAGYALLEAMSCGCIPVVTAIPSFKKMTNNRQYGYLYEPGSSDSLFEVLKQTGVTHKYTTSQIKEYVVNEFSFQSIAKLFYEISTSEIEKPSLKNKEQQLSKSTAAS